MASDIELEMPSMETEDDNCGVSESVSTHPAASSNSFPATLIGYILIVVGILFLAVVCALLVSIVLVVFALFVVSYIVLLPPLSPLINTIWFLWPKKKKNKVYLEGYGDDDDDDDDVQQEMADEGMYVQSTVTQERQYQFTIALGILISVVTLVFQLWLVINLSVPSLKRLTFLGSPLWKWSLGGVTLTTSYFLAAHVYLAFLVTLSIIQFLSRKPPREYYSTGLMSDGTFMLYSFIVLLSWLVYFRTGSGLKQPSTPHPQAFDYVTWTFVSLFIASILWVLKAFLLLKWRADVIYRRFEPRILITSVKFVCLCFFIDAFFQKHIITQILLYDLSNNVPPNVSLSKYIMSRKLQISYLEYVGQILTSLAQLVSLREEDGVSDVLRWFQDRIPNSDDKCVLDELMKLLSPTIEQRLPLINSWIPTSLKFYMEIFSTPEDPQTIARVLHTIAQEVHSSTEFTFHDLKRWMVDAHKDCVNMGRTLADAKAIVTCLDIFLSVIILAVVVLFWLLITGIATTKVLVAIATPVLALTFMFGDTAKTFFQGLVFCFATHSINVGDRCVIDQTELEVQSISILTSTFTKIETKEKVFYPNSVLSTKAIVNLGWQPDPTDIIEFTLSSSTSIDDLENEIKRFFSENQHYYKDSHKVMIKEVGDNIKVTVNFTHVLTVQDLTHTHCFQKKREQRSLLLKVIKQFINGPQTTLNQ